MYSNGYGMPSSHAQFMAFYSISLALFLLLRHNPTASSKATLSKEVFPYSMYPSPKIQRLVVSVAGLLLASSVALSRIYLSYHTGRQVLVGCSAGAFSALAWFFVTSFARYQGWLGILLDTELCKWLRLRDLVIEDDLVEAGWKEWEKRRHARLSQKIEKRF